MKINAKASLLNLLLFLLPINPCTSILDASEAQVAILGESFSEEDGELGANEEVLARLFKLIDKKNPKAVIFTGNMTLGLKKKDGASFSDQRQTLPLLENFGLVKWSKANYAYDSQHFQKMLNQFIAIKNRNLSNSIPFYPIIAEHEAYGPDSIERVITSFQVQNQVDTKINPLAYTFTVGKNLFVLFSTANYDVAHQSATEHQLSHPFLDWLSHYLKQQRKNYDNVFLVSNEPAFSTTSGIGNYQGFDSDSTRRDIFWKILIDNHVTAYFCSKEHLYDRTNRFGVWQIISGGAGAPFYKRDFDKAFYHYLLLTLSSENNKLPRVQVYDAQGNIDDDFELIPTQYPVYELRIS